MNDHIKPHELQHLLRQWEQLSGVTVGYKSAVVATPLMTVSGFINIRGELKAYETDVDAKDFRSADDVLVLVNSLLRSFEDAARQVA